MQIADEIFGTLSFDEHKLLTFGFEKERMGHTATQFVVRRG